MGKQNSSRTRVVPVFRRLYERDNTGISWLPNLLSLPIGGTRVPLPALGELTIQEWGWGDQEKRLDPPVALLSWLIHHPRDPVSGPLSSDPVKATKRREWIAGDETRRLEGLRLLRDNPTREDWHIFEGPTQPDVFIRTPDVIIVIEGKRTEEKPTTVRKWMPVRHQMLRHIDCAWEIAGRRKVIGFFIIQGIDPTGEVAPAWVGYAGQTVSREAIIGSLPHRGPEEQEGIISCFAGVTTWQQVCKTFGIDYSALPDRIEE